MPSPLVVTLKPGWRLEARACVSDRDRIDLSRILPRGTHVQLRVPGLSPGSRRSRSPAEDALARTYQVVLPAPAKRDRVLAALSKINCVELAFKAPNPSLPGGTR
jgi:hypothetical protein